MSQTTPPGWYPDPAQRFAERYWSVAGWTERVRTADGVAATDPPFQGAYAIDGPVQGHSGFRSEEPGTRRPLSGRWAYVVNPGLLMAIVGALLVNIAVIGDMDFVVLKYHEGGRENMSFSEVEDADIDNPRFGEIKNGAFVASTTSLLVTLPVAGLTGIRRVGTGVPGAAPRVRGGWPQVIAGVVAGALLLWLLKTTEDATVASGAKVTMLGYAAIVVGSFSWGPLNKR